MAILNKVYIKSYFLLNSRPLLQKFTNLIGWARRGSREARKLW